MMKRLSRFVVSIWLIFCVAAIAPQAYAVGTDGTDVPYDTGKINFETMSWDELIEEFLAAYKVSEGQVTIGYYNTVTGEEHFYDADRYMVSGSMYKVPLAMVYVEKDAAGEIDIENGGIGALPYKLLLEGIIVDSNNSYAETLFYALGSYYQYRRIIAPYMGEDPDAVDAKYYENNFFTARQMVTCLQKLYDEQETFGYVIELMKQAEPENYFQRYEDRYEVAHKYGWVTDELGYLHMNDCGIVYTDDPYILVCFTDGAIDPYGILGSLVTLMSDYTQYQYQERIAAEEAEAERLRAEQEAAVQEALQQEPVNNGPQEEVEEPEKPREVGRIVVLTVSFALALGLAIYAEIKKGGVVFKRMLIAVVCLLLVFALWFVSTSV